VTDTVDARDRRWIALALLCVAQFVVVLGASIVNVALPTIGRGGGRASRALNPSGGQEKVPPLCAPAC
jgi:hypothetical protein